MSFTQGHRLETVFEHTGAQAVELMSEWLLMTELAASVHHAAQITRLSLLALHGLGAESYLREAGLVTLVHRVDVLLALVERGRGRCVAQRRGIGYRAHHSGMRSRTQGPQRAGWGTGPPVYRYDQRGGTRLLQCVVALGAAMGIREGDVSTDVVLSAQCMRRTGQSMHALLAVSIGVRHVLC